MITFLIITVVKSSLALSLGLVGALSIIRFRTVVKDTKDTAFIFWSLAVGMAAGTSSYFLAVSGTIIISLIALILNYTNYGSIFKSEFIIQFRNTNFTKGKKKFNEIINEFSKSSTLLNAEVSGDNKSTKLSFDIMLKENKSYDDFIYKLSKVKGVSEVTAVAAKNDVDY